MKIWLVEKEKWKSEKKHKNWIIVKFWVNSQVKIKIYGSIRKFALD